MANDEEELAKITAAPGAGQGSLRPGAPESGSQFQTPAEPERAAMEPGDTAAPGPQSLDERFSLERHPPEASSPEPSAPEPVQPAPELVVPPPRLAGEKTKPRSLFPALAATAIAGAVLGFGGTFGLHYFGGSKLDFGGSKFDGFASGERVAALDARIAAIEGKEETASAASRAALAAMESRITDAENAANKAAQSANSAQADAQKALAAEPAAQEPGPGPAPAVADLGPLEARIDTLEQKLAPLEAALAAPKAGLRAQPGRADAAADLGPLEARIDTLEKKLAPLETALAAPKAGLRAQPDRADAAAGERSRAEAIAVVAASLLRKLESGGQFSGELAALENLRVPQASLAPLRAASESPVWSERQLTARFASLVPGIIASETAKQASADESFLDRVTRNAKGLLRVHRVGDAGAAGVEGFVARIENALADHDLEAALKAWHELPAAAKKSVNWGEAVKARLDALNAARSIEAEAVAVLGKAKS
ncbi:MAG: COG4223 family protein [Beijerinckiaceae bacterium]